MLSLLATASAPSLLDVLSLQPETLWHAVALLGFLFLCNYLLRTALMTEATRSPWVQAFVCSLTLLPAIALAVILLWAAYRHPERAWINFGIAALLYVPWGLGGALTPLARTDTEGADLGWLTMGAFITFPTALLAALIF
jgi:hypothetical protein